MVSVSFMSERLEGARSAEPPIRLGTSAAILLSTVADVWRVAIGFSNFIRSSTLVRSTISPLIAFLYAAASSGYCLFVLGEHRLPFALLLGAAPARLCGVREHFFGDFEGRARPAEVLLGLLQVLAPSGEPWHLWLPSRGVP